MGPGRTPVCWNKSNHGEPDWFSPRRTERKFGEPAPCRLAAVQKNARCSALVAKYEAVHGGSAWQAMIARGHRASRIPCGFCRPDSWVGILCARCSAHRVSAAPATRQFGTWHKARGAIPLGLHPLPMVSWRTRRSKRPPPACGSWLASSARGSGRLRQLRPSARAAGGPHRCGLPAACGVRP